MDGEIQINVGLVDAWMNIRNEGMNKGKGNDEGSIFS
jgi:hypothetical protein